MRNTTGLEEATADAHTALELARQIGYATGEARALMELSVIASYADDGERAVEWARQAQRIDRDLMPGWLARKVEHVLPYVMVMSGHLDGALELCVQALAQAKAAGDLSDEADTLFLMAALARQTGRLADVRRLPARDSRARHACRLPAAIDRCPRGGRVLVRCGRAVRSRGHTVGCPGRPDEAAGLADTPEEIHRREQPLREARQALDAQQVRAAEERGAAMTLAAAAEFAIMMTGENVPEPTVLPGPGKLSSRERELVTLVARGQTDAQIAEQLFISVSTVRTHLDRIRDKSGCRRRADLTRLALQEGII